jgi:hypothetical protein
MGIGFLWFNMGPVECCWENKETNLQIPCDYCRLRNCGSWNYYFYLFICGAGVEPSPLLLRLFIGLLYQPCTIDGDDCEAISGMNEWQGKPTYSEETCPIAALSITDPTWPDTCLNSGRRGGKPAINRLSYGTAIMELATTSLHGHQRISYN